MLAKTTAFVRIAARERLRDRAAIIGRMGFYALILFIFTRLWNVVLEQRPIDGLDASSFVWYLAITEWIVLSVPMLFLDIEKDVRDGDLVYKLTRPLPYPVAKLAEGFGDLLVRMAFLGAFGFALAWAYTGHVPMSLHAWMLLLPVGLAAGALTLVFYAIIGVLAFWIHDSRPIYWMWQKASFVLGGLIVPLELYPDWLRTVAAWSPFSALLHGPGQLALGAPTEVIAIVIAKLAAWTVVAALLLAWIYKRGLRAVAVGGG